MSQVWQYQLGSNDQSVLLAMADHAHDDGTKVFPSVARIAWKIGASIRTVRRSISSLRKRGVLKTVKKGGGLYSTEYIIILEGLIPKKPFREDTRVKMTEVTPVKMTPVSPMTYPPGHSSGRTPRPQLWPPNLHKPSYNRPIRTPQKALSEEEIEKNRRRCLDQARALTAKLSSI